MSLAVLAKIQRLEKLRRRQELAQQLRPEQASRTESADSILDLVERLSPNLHRPNHFRLYAERLEQAVGNNLRVVFSAPPQHGKTEVTLHGLVWLILRYPDRRHAYVTYSQKRADSVSRKVRRMLAAAGVVVTGTLAQMGLPGGGQCLFTSIDGGITGEPVDGVAIIDDPYKNRKEADSANRRQVVEDSYRDAIETRVHPGASIFLLATRWHPQDLSGTLQGEGWELINLPAIAENDNDPNGRAVGEALFPLMWPIEALERKRAKVLEFTWQALYQGRPRPRGGKVFHEPTYYQRLPTSGYRGCFGLDLAYTAKTSADWSICLELWRTEPPRKGGEPLYYVVRVDRAQVKAPSFALTLKARHVQRQGWRMHWRASGVERGAASFLKRAGLPVHVHNPPGDKLVCAQHAAPAWNAGRIMVPDPEFFPGCEEWLYPFLDILQNFTGTGKEHDDDVDALATAFDNLDRVVTGAYSELKGRT